MSVVSRAGTLLAGAAGVTVGWLLAAARRGSAAEAPPASGTASVNTRAMAATAEALARAIEARSHWSGTSLRRMQQHAVALAVKAGLGPDEVEAVRLAALLHDIGTLAVPPHILAKPGPLTADEFERVRVHPAAGAALLADIDVPAAVGPLVLGHHERWDGRGYPSGAAGEDIPVGARVLAIADAYHSLRSLRPYRQPYSPERARDVLAREAGSAFDPALVRLFLDEVAGQDHDVQDAPEAFDGIALAQRESALLYDLSQAMNVTLDVTDTVRALLSRLRVLLPHHAAAVFLLGDDGLLRCAVADGLDAEHLRILPLDDDQAAPVRAVRTGRTIVNGDPVREVVPGPVGAGPALRSSLVTPLSASGSTFGALALYAARTEAFHDDHARTIARVTQHAAASVFNALRFEQARTDSLTDALTGLPNARFLLMHLTQELARATRLGSELSLLIIDVDDFKRVNDVAGHHVGDRVLREVARVLKTGIRAYDVCARYAGDEFLVMLAECGAQEVEDRRTQIEQALSRVTVDAGERRIRVKASVGAAVFPHDGQSFESLLASADREMYRNKARSKGRRRTIPLSPVTADKPPVSPQPATGGPKRH